MAVFPVLCSGAVTQYPTQLLTGRSVQVIRFLDGLDQRFLNQSKQFRCWAIQLELLSESELAAIEAFFASQKGAYSTFTFPDPFSKKDVPNCRLGSPELVTDYLGMNRNSVSFWVTETNG